MTEWKQNWQGSSNMSEKTKQKAEQTMKWTDEQQQVIDIRNRNLLVSAAAGSALPYSLPDISDNTLIVDWNTSVS